ncbi:MAG: cytochrome c oxidase subunit II [Planctomycetaceae bacterium]|nr:cytochrome c oxidase subunit II [Planctomycetaceae bacterium]
MNRFWCFFFTGAAALAVLFCIVGSGPTYRWWFPGPSISPLGAQIDDLFYLILVITTVTFIGVNAILGYVLWKYGSGKPRRSDFSHGSHTLEVVSSIVTAGVLLFIALYQMDVWYRYRVKSTFDREAVAHPVAEVTARQFEWRIRYPGPGKTLEDTPQPTDLYTVNDLHVPSGKPVLIKLRSEDVLHSFFLPHLRIKQDAVPGLVIPVWFQADKTGIYDLVCAELCGWGHYKMRGQLTAEREDERQSYLKELSKTQFDDGVAEKEKSE